MTNVEYQRELYAERKSEAIKLLGSRCVACGNTERLQFDHIDPSSKSSTITSILKGRRDRFLEELKLCQLLCETCHKNKTVGERDKWKHGTIHGYMNKRCRCGQCREAQGKYQADRAGREYKAKRRVKPHRECGTYAMYKHGCRCGRCKDANNTYMRNWHRRRGSGASVVIASG